MIVLFYHLVCVRSSNKKLFVHLQFYFVSFLPQIVKEKGYISHFLQVYVVSFLPQIVIGKEFGSIFFS